jgi:hypothetical protein
MTSAPPPGTSPELSELDRVVARNQIELALRRYNWNGDAFKIEQLAAQFAEDGTLHVHGEDPVTGRAAIVTKLTRSGERGAPTGVGELKMYIRHFVTNVLVENITATTADARSYFLVFTPLGPDHWGRYRDTMVKTAEGWRIQHRYVRVDPKVGGSPWRDGVHTDAISG